MLIDTSFDFRDDTPPGRDPDSHSPTLRTYHRILWSKPLPDGSPFDLVETTPGVYLHHCSPRGEFFLGSDSAIPTFTREPRLADILRPVPGDGLAAFYRSSYTIGGMMVFPGNCIGRRMTINGARGFHPRIKDRFDLTVECIRRHYVGEGSPLSGTIERYSDFFALFLDFRGYAEFFLLQDLVSDDGSRVEFFLPFDDFRTSPLPGSTEAYLSYRRLAMDFIEARNARIRRWAGGDRSDAGFL